MRSPGLESSSKPRRVPVAIVARNETSATGENRSIRSRPSPVRQPCGGRSKASARIAPAQEATDSRWSVWTEIPSHSGRIAAAWPVAARAAIATTTGRTTRSTAKKAVRTPTPSAPTRTSRAAPREAGRQIGGDRTERRVCRREPGFGEGDEDAAAQREDQGLAEARTRPRQTRPASREPSEDEHPGAREQRDVLDGPEDRDEKRRSRGRRAGPPSAAAPDRPRRRRRTIRGPGVRRAC